MERADVTRDCEAARDRVALLAALARPLQHDINNLLTVVYANLEMLRRTAAEGAPRRQLDRVEEAARRIDAGSRAFLSLTRRPPGLQAAPATLTEAVGALRPLLQMMLPTPGSLVLDLEPEAWPVRLDRARFDQALMHLAEAAVREAAGPAPQERLALMVANRTGAGPGGADASELLVRAPFAVSGAAHGILGAVAEEAGGTIVLLGNGRQLQLLLPRHDRAPATGG